MEASLRERLFTLIYRNRVWGGRRSASGRGSDPQQTQRLIAQLPSILRDYGVRSLLDVPCGDFCWMSAVDLAGISYMGGDIVGELVGHVGIFERENISFRRLDILTDELPSADLLLCRDCLVHFSTADVLRALRNICQGRLRYLLATTFTGRDANPEIVTGQWRPLNLQAAPFGFPEPLALLVEGCTEENGQYSDKSLGLWRVEDIRKLESLHAG